MPDSKVDDTVAAVRRARKQGKIVTPRAVKKSLPELPEEALYWMWLRWRLGEGEFKKQGPGNQPTRPKVLPKKVPARMVGAAGRFRRGAEGREEEDAEEEAQDEAEVRTRRRAARAPSRRRSCSRGTS